MRWLIVILAAGLAAPAARAQQAPASPPPQLQITLPEAIRRAIDVQPAMIEARGDQRNAGASKRSAYGAFIPTVTLGSSAARSNITRIDNTTGRPVPAEYSYTGSFNASLELFDGFRRFANLKATAALDQAAEAGVVNARFLTTLQTKELFYAEVANEALVRVADAQLARARQQLQISIDKLHAGSATRSDSLRSTVDYGNARIALLQAQANLATAQATLGRQIGVDQPVRAVPDSTLPDLPDTGALRATPLDDAPQVQQTQAQASAARAQVWTARAQYLPSLTLSYADSRQGLKSPQVPLFGNLPDSYRWTFSVSFPLFNGFVREQNQVNASVTRDNAEAVAADTRRQVNAQMTQQIAAMTTAYAKIDISRANVAAATEDLRVQNERYRVGAATILDLLTSQTALTTAEGGLVQALFDYLIARAQVEALVGRTL